jgi:hypothetical protein
MQMNNSQTNQIGAANKQGGTPPKGGNVNQGNSKASQNVNPANMHKNRNSKSSGSLPKQFSGQQVLIIVLAVVVGLGVVGGGVYLMTQSPSQETEQEDNESSDSDSQIEDQTDEDTDVDDNQNNEEDGDGDGDNSDSMADDDTDANGTGGGGDTGGGGNSWVYDNKEIAVEEKEFVVEYHPEDNGAITFRADLPKNANIELKNDSEGAYTEISFLNSRLEFRLPHMEFDKGFKANYQSVNNPSISGLYRVECSDENVYASEGDIYYVNNLKLDGNCETPNGNFSAPCGLSSIELSAERGVQVQFVGNDSEVEIGDEIMKTLRLVN